MYSIADLQKLTFLTLACGALAACMQGTTPPPEPVSPPPEPTSVVTPEPATPQQPPADPARLEQATPGTVVSLMGEPSLMRRDGSVQVMLFENHDCVLEVVFMEPGPDAHFEATHITARTRDGQDTDTGQCLAQILPDGVWPDGQ